MRIGTGYDVHRLVKGRELIIGGEHIPHETGLLGHSDADVLVHAIMDALLGAAALGDIGLHFPDNDEAYKGASSLELLKKVGEILEEHLFFISNIDSTIIAQTPKMRPHIDKMRDNIAQALGISPDMVSVKATTEEGLGFTGEGKGIAAQAVCILETPGEAAGHMAYYDRAGQEESDSESNITDERNIIGERNTSGERNITGERSTCGEGSDLNEGCRGCKGCSRFL